MNTKHPEPLDSRAARRDGFTVTEVMVASAVSMVVIGALMTVFLTVADVLYEAKQRAYGQAEVQVSVNKMLQFMRSANEISDIDPAGEWVSLKMPDGRHCRFEYYNPNKKTGEGQMIFMPDVTSTNAFTNVVARGLTEVMTDPPRNIFHKTSDTTLRIAFRVTMPLSPGAAPAEVDTGVFLRNR